MHFAKPLPLPDSLDLILFVKKGLTPVTWLVRPPPMAQPITVEYATDRLDLPTHAKISKIRIKGDALCNSSTFSIRLLNCKHHFLRESVNLSRQFVKSIILSQSV